LDTEDYLHRSKNINTWNEAIFRNPSVMETRSICQNTRLKVACELLSCFRIFVTPEDIRRHCFDLIDTVSYDFHHDKRKKEMIYVSGGATIITEGTKGVVVNESPTKGPIILHGPMRDASITSFEFSTYLPWDLKHTVATSGIFPVGTGRRDKLSKVKNRHTSVSKLGIPSTPGIIYPGMNQHFDEKGVPYPIGRGDTPSFNERLSPLCYNTRSPRDAKAELYCGKWIEYPKTELQPICVRIAPAVERKDHFDS